MTGRRTCRRVTDDAGVTLVELLVAAMLMAVLGAMVLATVVSAAEASRRARAQHDLNEEARTVLNRMSRELRQAESITFVTNPDGAGVHDPAKLTAISFTADFNGDGCTGNSCSGTNPTVNPEDVTYCFDPRADDGYLWLIPQVLTSVPAGCDIGSGAQPVLAGHVAEFTLAYRSNQYRFDADGDGVTTWQELDDATPPTGDGGGSDRDINTSALAGVDSVAIRLRLARDGLAQSYDTQVDLRNRS